MTNTFIEKITTYISAKDNHKPHLMESAFTVDATLTMRVDTAAISFPSEVHGRDKISETLVRNFHAQYENVYTFCIKDSIAVDAENLNCRWMVIMTEKETGLPRIGYGDYFWVFD